MKDPDSSRSVFIVRAEGNEALIEVSQPSDCLLLQRDHVQCSDLVLLVVLVDDSFINQINGPPELQSPYTWKEAVHHLLDTYKLTWCEMHVNDSQTGIQDGHQVVLADGTSYISFWNKSHNLLTIVP